MRLDNAATALNDGIKLLHARYPFRRLHVVAHSMGGLVARDFVIQTPSPGGRPYINTFITFSSPWDGHEAAAMGVKYAPEVVPSWRDMKHGSDFLNHLYDKKLKGRVNHHLFYSHHAKRSPILPPENDGTVSVASQTPARGEGGCGGSAGFRRRPRLHPLLTRGAQRRQEDSGSGRRADPLQPRLIFRRNPQSPAPHAMQGTLRFENVSKTLR